MKLKGVSLHIALNGIFILGACYIWINYSAKLEHWNFFFVTVLIYSCFLYMSGGFKAIKEYFIIKKGQILLGEIEYFVYGIRILGIAGYYPVVSYTENKEKKIIKYKSYRTMKKEKYTRITIYKWKIFSVPLEFSEWEL